MQCRGTVQALALKGPESGSQSIYRPTAQGMEGASCGLCLLISNWDSDDDLAKLLQR